MEPVSLQAICDQAREAIKKGDVLKGLNALKNAAKSNPDSAQIHFELGNAYRIFGDIQNAAEAFGQAIKCKNDFFAAYFNLGSALKVLGRFSEALCYLQEAAALMPDFADTYLLLGNILNLTGDYSAAINVLEKGISLKPGSADFYISLSQAFAGLKDLKSSEKTLKNALSVIPDSATVFNSLGNLYMLKDDLKTAKDYYCSALRIKPDLADAHYHLGIIMRKWCMLDEAAICFKNALRFNPGDSSILTDYGECCLAKGEFEAAEQAFQEILKGNPSDVAAADNLLLCLNYDPSCSNEQIFSMHRYLTRRCVFSEDNSTKVSVKRSSEASLRVGYLSSDFCKHPSATVLLPVFRNHNKEHFQVYAYSHKIHDDEITASFKELAYRWRNIETLDDRNVCELVKNDRIDILVDCTGHMSGNRLGVFALRAAPIQISAIGYPNTTGLQSMDYRISDDIADPPGEKSFFTEELLRLPSGFCCYQPLSEFPQVTPLPSKESGVITFGSTHTLARLNQQVVRLWSDVLHAVPHSRLLIFRNTLCQSAVKRMQNWFVGFGVDANRIIFQNRVPADGHLSIYTEIDITLDTFPWSGHVTACESLMMGVPIISLKGNRFAGRMVSSILSRVGLPELIAETEGGYVNIANKLAGSLKRLSEYRMTLRKQMLDSQLCDCKGFVKCLEESYRNLVVTRERI